MNDRSRLTRPAQRPSRGWLGPALVYGGAALVGANLYQKQKTKHAESAHPPVGRFLTVEGTKVHYVDIGEGPPIVLLHGIGSTLDDWFTSGLVAHLLPHHRIIAIDRPGYGYSKRPHRTQWTAERQARLIARVLHRLGVDRAVLVAHSFGVLPALALALSEPQKVRALALLGGVYLPGSTIGGLGKFLPTVPVLGRVARATLSPSLARAALPALVRTMFEPQPVTPAFREHFSPDFATRPGQLHASGEDLAEIAAATRRLTPHYERLEVPIAVITGSGDAIFDPDRQSHSFAALVPTARLNVAPAAGHMLHHTDTARVAATILALLAPPPAPAEPEPEPDAPADEAGSAAEDAAPKKPAPARKPRASRARSASTRKAGGKESEGDTAGESAADSGTADADEDASATPKTTRRRRRT